jgi:hypothetical protein
MTSFTLEWRFDSSQAAWISGSSQGNGPGLSIRYERDIADLITAYRVSSASWYVFGGFSRINPGGGGRVTARLGPRLTCRGLSYVSDWGSPPLKCDPQVNRSDGRFLLERKVIPKICFVTQFQTQQTDYRNPFSIAFRERRPDRADRHCVVHNTVTTFDGLADQIQCVRTADIGKVGEYETNFAQQCPCRAIRIGRRRKVAENLAEHGLGLGCLDDHEPPQTIHLCHISVVGWSLVPVGIWRAQLVIDGRR